MNTTNFAPVDLEISRLGFGCAGLMRVTSRADRMALLGAALDVGISHFDVARMYGLGAAEGEVGRFLVGKRESATIATKFGLAVPAALGRFASLQRPARSLANRVPVLRRAARRGASRVRQEHRYDEQAARSSLETSLRELRTDYVDLFLLHEPPSMEHVWRDELCAYLESAQGSGHIRAWGVAGGDIPYAALRASASTPIVLQHRDDIFSALRSTTSEQSEPSIVFGVLATALPRIVSHLAADPARERHWMNTLGVDVIDSGLIASLLVRDALARGPRNAILFSTTQPGRLTGMVDQALRVNLAHEDNILARFRTLVHADFD
jgi:hypothetical protein